MAETVEINAKKLANLRKENRALKEKANGMVLVAEIRAGPLRLEAVERNGSITFCSCFDNDIRAHMGQSEAEMFAKFVNDTLEAREATPDA